MRKCRTTIPCNSLAIQRAKLVPKILAELTVSEDARNTLVKLVESLIPGVRFEVRMPEIAYTHRGRAVPVEFCYLQAINGATLRVWINKEQLTVSGEFPGQVNKLQSELDKSLPKLAAMFAGRRGRAAIEKKYGAKTERVSAGVYRQKLSI